MLMVVLHFLSELLNLLKFMSACQLSVFSSRSTDENAVKRSGRKREKNIYKLLSFALLLFHSLFFALWTRQFTSILPHSSSLFWVSCFHSWTLLPHIESDIHRRGQSKQLAGAEFGNFIHVLSLVHFYGDRRSLIAR